MDLVGKVGAFSDTGAVCSKGERVRALAGLRLARKVCVLRITRPLWWACEIVVKSRSHFVEPLGSSQIESRIWISASFELIWERALNGFLGIASVVEKLRRLHNHGKGFGKAQGAS